jgi:co-chaperonin GroES (HSP10)
MPKKTKGGIIIPDSAKAVPQGEVTAVARAAATKLAS